MPSCSPCPRDLSFSYPDIRDPRTPSREWGQPTMKELSQALAFSFCWVCSPMHLEPQYAKGYTLRVPLIGVRRPWPNREVTSALNIDISAKQHLQLSLWLGQCGSFLPSAISVAFPMGSEKRMHKQVSNPRGDGGSICNETLLFQGIRSKAKGPIRLASH